MTVDLPLARRDVIVTRLAAGEPVVAVSLATEFGVSEDAIRRDLRALAAEGRCRRVYGGALPVSTALQPMTARMGEGGDRKRLLARAAGSAFRPGEVVFLDSSSTNLALVEFLPEEAELTIVTNAVEIAAAVLRRQDLRLIVVGGSADPVVGGCIDAAATRTVSRMKFGCAVIGACSVSLTDGIAAFHFADAAFKRCVIEAARRIVVLATTDKFAEDAPHHVARLREVDLIVVEPDVSADRRAALSAAGCQVLVAENG